MQTDNPTIIVKRTIPGAKYTGTLLSLRDIVPDTVVLNLATHDPHSDPIQPTLDAAVFGRRVIAEVRSAPSPTEHWDVAKLESRVAGLQATWPETAPTIVLAILCEDDLRDFDGLDVTVSAHIAGERPWNSRDVDCRTFGEFRTEFAGMIEGFDDLAWALAVVDDTRQDRTLLTLRRCGFLIDTPRIRLRAVMDGPHTLTRPEGGATVVLGGCDFGLYGWEDGSTTIRRLNGPLCDAPPKRIDTSVALDATALREVLWELLEEEVLR